MIDRLRINFLFQHDPELRHYRVRLTWVAAIAFLCLLMVWLVWDLIFFLPLEADRTFDFAFDLGLIFLMAAASVFALRLGHRGNVNFGGIILAAAIFILTLIVSVIFPNDIYTFSTGFLFAIMVVGAIVGGRPVYAFAGLGLVATLIAWLRANNVLSGQANLVIQASDFIFLLGQVVISLGLAAMLHTFSQHIQQTIDRLQSQTDQLTQLAHTDPLTSLANRRYLIEQLEREYTRARRYRRPLSLIYLDLDGFKSINDRFGHIFGDQILRGMALAMRAVLRSADLLARIGGDEFAILLPETALHGAQRVSNKLRKALTAYQQHLGPMIPSLTFCAGICQLREDDQSIDDLLARSDEALYQAKDAGQGQTRSQREFDQLPLFEDTDHRLESD